MKNKIIIRSALILFILLVSTQSTRGQQTGHLKGRVSDSGGGAIEKATLIAETSTSKFETTTNENGEFDIELPSGTYTLSIKNVPGFINFKRDKVRVKPGKVSEMKIKLKVNLEDAECILWVTSLSLKKYRTSGKKRGSN